MVKNCLFSIYPLVSTTMVIRIIMMLLIIIIIIIIIISIIIISIIIILLSFGSLQLIAVYSFPNAKYVNLCHIFFHVSASHEVRHLVLPGSLQSSSSPPTVPCPLVNFLRPMTILHSKEVSIPFQLPS